MPTLVRRKPTLHRKTTRKQTSNVSTSAKLELSREEAALENAVGAAAARDLATRLAAADAEDAALVNAVARAAARSLAS